MTRTLALISILAAGLFSVFTGESEAVTEYFVGGDFETRDFSYWNDYEESGGGLGSITVVTNHPHSGMYSFNCTVDRSDGVHAGLLRGRLTSVPNKIFR